MIPDGSIISGFISKVISDCVDISKQAIKKADNSRKSTEQTLQTRIYQVIIDVLNRITNNTYKNQELIYLAAEKILNDLKTNDSNVIEAIRSGLNIINNSSNDECNYFLNVLCEEISNEKNILLYKEILLLLLQQTNEQNYILLKQIKEQLEQINKKLNKEKVKRDKIESLSEKKFKNNKKQKYINNWNSKLFLHLSNEEKPIILADAFIMPDYKIYPFPNRIVSCDDDTLDNIIEKFVKYDRTSTMLITGVPGIGKSTITSWTANKYKEDDRFVILRFRDWESEELKNGFLKAICNTLECQKRDLDTKILILDGFDEIKCLDEREHLLNTFINDIKDFENIKIIITSRPAYINQKHFQNVVELKEFNIKKVEAFYTIITGKTLDKKVQVMSNLEVLGIPVILYMAIMSNVDISESSTKPELYNRIFAQQGGIFDKFCEYDNGSQILRNSENIEKYLAFLQKVAFKMFEKDCLMLDKKECEIPPLKFNGHNVSILEFPIKYLFENTESNIEFIHQSIYEYFVSQHIYSLLEKNIKRSNKDLAKILGNMLKMNHLSPEILEFLEFKIKTGKLSNAFYIINDTFNLMLKEGMTYNIKNHFKNIIDLEMTIFTNMLEVVHLWEREVFEVNKLITHYIKYNYKFILNLKRVDLRGVDLNETYLKGANLLGANLEEVNLEGANLKDADLIRTNLIRAKLKGADLLEANLNEAKLKGADLEKAYLNGADLKNANLKEAYLKDANLSEVNLNRTNLERAYIENSIWNEDDIQNALLQLKETKFSYIIIQDEYGQKRVHKSKIFPDKQSFFSRIKNIFRM